MDRLSGSYLYHQEQYSRREFEWDAANSDFSKIQRVWPTIDGPLDILDVGCGSGSVSKRLLEEGHRVAGVDIMEEAVRRARQMGVQATVCDIDSGPTPFESASFDSVLMLDVLEHIWQPLQVLTEAQRLLRKRGFAIISIPNHFDLVQRWQIVRGGGNVHYAANCEGRQFHAWDYYHIRFFTVREIYDLVKAAGLRVDKASYLRLPQWPSVLKNRIGEQLCYRFPSLLSSSVILRLSRGTGR